MSPNTNVLVVAEDATLYDVIKGSPISNRSNISYCRAEDDVLSYLKDNSVHVVITDMESNGHQRMSLLSRVKQFDPLIDVIIVADPADSDDFMSFVKQGALVCLTRPLEVSALVETFRKIEERKTLRKETHRLEKKLDKHYLYRGMVGKSPFMLDIFNLIDIIASNFSIVLITGETGTGKELVARAIHEASPLSDGKLVVCNCAAIPEHLFESELFGYTKGAFTGADRDKEGFFEEADNGTIFMDEIGEIPLTTQAKLLRVLEYGHFRPLGSNEDKMVDVRVIASTNRDLRECIRNRTFREDLFYRLNKQEITLPPLRERQEDIPLLVRYFLGHCRKKFSKKIMGISRQLQKFFLQYPWPGNVRELENVLENSFMISKKEFIDMADIPQYLQKVIPAVDRMPFLGKKKLMSLEELEKSYLSYLLKITNGNLRKTAQILDISRTTLYSKLAKYNIQR